MKSRFSLIFLAFLACSLSSCISRLSRPALSGTVLDYNNQPIPGCKVGETVTDLNGKFYLKEIRYNAFLLSEIFVMEAPPLHVEERIEKPGYKKVDIFIHESRGGGKRKGAHYAMDTIFLKRNNEVLAVKELVLAKWNFYANKNADTLYATNVNFRTTNSALHDARSVFNNMEFDLRYQHQAPKPRDTAWAIDSYTLQTKGVLELKSDGTYRSTIVRSYSGVWDIALIHDDRTKRRSSSLPNGTLSQTGKFNFSNSQIGFSNGLLKQKATFKIDTIDRDVMALTLIK